MQMQRSDITVRTNNTPKRFAQLFRRCSVGALVSMSLFFSFDALANSKKMIIVYPRPESENDLRGGLPFSLLDLALTRAGIAYELQPSEHSMQQNQALRLLANDVEINVVWTMTSKEREQDFLPVRIPIDKGLMGWRLLLVNKREAAKFGSVRTFQELRPYSAGQGHDWPDVDILASNGISVVKSDNYESLFKMLDRNRFEFFPRSILEIQDEMNAHKDLDIEIEKTIVLHYPAAEYFFVNKHNVRLAKALETGLSEAIKDGSFDKLFNKFNSDAIKRADFLNRQVITLTNPSMPEATPFSNKELWFDPNQH